VREDISSIEPARTLRASKRGTRLPLVPLALIAMLAAGCAAYRAEPISASAGADSIDARTLDDPRLEAFLASLEGGGAYTLDRLTLTALYYHPNLEVSRSRLAAAAAAVETARQIPNPQAILNFTTGPWSAAPIVNFLIETAGRRGIRTEAAREMVQAAREDIANAVWQVRGGVRTAMLALWGAESRAGFLKERLELQDQLVQLLERRFEEGEASALDVTRERINRNQASLALKEFERLRAEGLARLATAIGVPAGALEGVTLSFASFERPPVPLMDVPELRRTALTGRSDVQGLLAEYRAAETGLRLEIANQYPNLTVGPGYNYSIGRNAYFFTPGVIAALPVFNRNEGPIAEAEARRQGAVARFVALQARILGAIDTGETSYRAAGLTVETADALLADARRRNDQISRSFEAGDTDRPALVTAAIEVVAAEHSRFDARLQQRQELGSLEDALQHPLFDPDASLFVPLTNPRFTSVSQP
jgi:cobalt-zinc-cadmium efflux system outer membrane protein